MGAALIVAALGAILSLRALRRRRDKAGDEMFERDWRGPNQL